MLLLIWIKALQIVLYTLLTLIFTTHEPFLVFSALNKTRKKSTLVANAYWPLFDLPIS